jgi:hypothetical protein
MDKPFAEMMMTRTHSRIAAKQKIWRLIQQSYAGGVEYLPSENLFRHPKEDREGFSERSRRAVYFNHVQPLVDIVSGFLYAQPPEREIPAALAGFASMTSRGKSLEEFVQSVAIHSLQYTVGVLVDMPAAPEGIEIRTRADVAELGLQPFAVLYLPQQICDFATDEQGRLIWVLLDNTREVDEDPTAPRSSKVQRRLWTRTYWQDFEKVQAPGAKTEYVAGEPQEHGFGEVPFRFVNWRDLNQDQIAETPVEDIALLDRKYYNAESLLDEMLYSGSFKMLAFEGTSADLPGDIEAHGVSGVTVLTHPQGTQPPAFIGAGLEDVGAFLTALKHYEDQMLAKLGMDPDHDKKYVQSGVAKSLEFRKCESILEGGAKALEGLETWMLRAAATWLEIEYDGRVQYSRGFQGDILDAELARLYKLLLLRSETRYRQIIEKLIVRKSLREESPEILKDLEREIEREPEPIPDTIDLTEMAQNTAP